MRRGTLCLFLSFVFLPLSVSGLDPFAMGHPIQLLERLGIRNGAVKDSAHVIMGKGKRKGDSPIYYIKLPPMNHYPPFNNPSFNDPSSFSEPSARFPLSPNAFHQVDLDFITNGKPAQIYHWNYKPHVPMHTPNTFPKAPEYPSTNDIFNLIDMPPQIPLIAPTGPVQALSSPHSVVPSTLISINKDFFYNGKPSKIYIWKPRAPRTPSKYKHPFFKHFNY